MRYRAEILTIGDELLKGSVLNTNALFLARELTDMGFSVQAQVACPDSPAVIGQKLAQALSDRGDLVILSGGLGPTPDDVTREALAHYFQVPLVFSKAQYAGIKKHYRKHGLSTVPSDVRKEAYYPENAVPLMNRYGIALGFYVRQGNGLVVVLPGVPSELEKMFKELVRPLLVRHFSDLEPRPKLVVKIVGLSEPAIMRKLGRDFFKGHPFEFGIYPEAGEVSIRIMADRQKIIQRLTAKIKKRLGRSVYAYEENRVLSEAVGKALVLRKRTLSIAESCTGGTLSSEITKIPGASRYFKGGMVVYHNSLKEDLGIEKSLLKKKGAVSREVALALAKAVRRRMRTYYGIGITGIAGPTGGSAQKPVGLVFIGLATPQTARLKKILFWGDRRQVQTKAAKKALEYLWHEIQ
jgi:nicotinamide-nucleotide amidase